HAVAIEDLSARVETDRDLPAVDLLLEPAHAPRGSFRADAGPVRALVRGEDDPSDPLHGGGAGHADALLQGLRPVVHFGKEVAVDVRKALDRRRSMDIGMHFVSLYVNSVHSLGTFSCRRRA